MILRKARIVGEYGFGRGSLPGMNLGKRNSEQIPFHRLLKQINETRREGLEVGDD